MAVEANGKIAFLDDARRIAGLAGLFFIVVFFAGIFAQGDSAMSGDSASEIRNHFAKDANRYLVGDWLIGLAVVFGFLPFVAGLRGVLGSADRTGGLLGRIALLGGLVFALIGGASSGFDGAIAFTKGQGLDDSTLVALNEAANYTLTTSSFGLALLLTASSAVILRTGVFWRWLAALGALSAVLILVGALSALQHEGESLLGFLQLLGLVTAAVFVLLLSIQMLRGQSPVATRA